MASNLCVNPRCSPIALHDKALGNLRTRLEQSINAAEDPSQDDRTKQNALAHEHFMRRQHVSFYDMVAVQKHTRETYISWHRASQATKDKTPVDTAASRQFMTAS